MAKRSSELVHNVMTDVQGFFNPGERERIFAAAENDRDRLLVRLLWKSGRRISEILQLKISDIDFYLGNIIWNIGKKRGEYRVPKPIDSTTLEMLKDFVDGKDRDSFVFPSYGKSGHLTRFRAFQIIRKLSDKAEVYYVGNKRPHPHHFRHSFATDVVQKIKNPADVRKLQKYLEHSTLGMTEVYLRIKDDEMRGIMEDLDD